MVLPQCQWVKRGPTRQSRSLSCQQKGQVWGGPRGWGRAGQGREERAGGLAASCPGPQQPPPWARVVSKECANVQQKEGGRE